MRKNIIMLYSALCTVITAIDDTNAMHHDVTYVSCNADGYDDIVRKVVEGIRNENYDALPTKEELKTLPKGFEVVAKLCVDGVVTRVKNTYGEQEGFINDFLKKCNLNLARTTINKEDGRSFSSTVKITYNPPPEPKEKTQDEIDADMIRRQEIKQREENNRIANEVRRKKAEAEKAIKEAEEMERRREAEEMKRKREAELKQRREAEIKQRREAEEMKRKREADALERKREAEESACNALLQDIDSQINGIKKLTAGKGKYEVLEASFLDAKIVFPAAVMTLFLDNVADQIGKRRFANAENITYAYLSLLFSTLVSVPFLGFVGGQLADAKYRVSVPNERHPFVKIMRDYRTIMHSHLDYTESKNKKDGTIDFIVSLRKN
ncbi:MAG: cell envelope integrity protein TolA [Holosporaceae bacterium]|nr:cell envelope integrity protein TolA [Holosporaceae bacterium]